MAAITDEKINKRKILKRKNNDETENLPTTKKNTTEKFVLNENYYLVIGDTKGKITIFSNCFDPVDVIEAYSGRVIDLDVSSDAKHIITIGNEKKISVWEKQSGQLVASPEFETWIENLVFSPDGQTIAFGLLDDIVLWSMEKKMVVKQWNAHDKMVTSLAYSSDGKWIVSGSRDHMVKLWDSETGKLLQTFIGHSKKIKHVAISKDKKWLASYSDIAEISIWCIENLKTVSVLNIEGDSSEYGVQSMDFSVDSTMLVTSCHDKIEFWNVITGQLVKKIEHKDSMVTNMSLSPDGKHVAAVIVDHGIKIWEIMSGQLVGSIPCNNHVVCLAFSTKG